MRLIITDRDLAVPPIDPDSSGIGAMFIRAPNLIDLLIFFERLWSDAQPLLSGSADHEAPTGQQVIEGCSPRGYLIVQGQHVSDRSARNQDEIEVPV